jgi:regulatory protein
LIGVNSFKGCEEMKITAIEEQKKNSKKLNIYIDGEYHSSVDTEIFDELGLSEGMELSPLEFNEKMEKMQYKSALRTALYMLMRSSKTEGEIRKRLKEKKYSVEAIDSVLQYLKEIGYINDESYTENFIRSNTDSPGVSKRSIYYKLAGKGIDIEVVRQKLEEAEIDDYGAALKAAQKKEAGLKGSRKEKASKLLSFLYRKGFGAEVCRKVIEELDLNDD